jgi:hypothetical protein
MLLATSVMHGACTILHIVAMYANHKGFAILSSLFMMLKTVTFIVVIMMLQAFLLGNAGSLLPDKKSWLDKFMNDEYLEEVGQKRVILWLIY